MKNKFSGRSARTVWSVTGIILVLSYLIAVGWLNSTGSADVKHALQAAPSSSSDVDADRFAFSADGKTLAFVDNGGRIMLLDVVSAQTRLVLPGHFADAIKQLAFSPDAKTLASLGEESIELWDAASGQGHATLPLTDGVSAAHLVFSPDGARLAVLGQGADIALWDIRDGSVRALTTGHQGAVNAAAFSRTGSDLASVADDGRIKIWNLARGQERSTFSGKAGGALLDVIFSPDGKLLATAGSNSAITLWNRRTGVARQLLPATGAAKASPMALSVDGKTLATINADAQIGLWDVASSQLRLSLPAEAGIDVTDLLFSPDGRFLAGVGSDYQIRLWDLSLGTLSQVLVGQRAAIVKVAFVAGGRYVASVATDGQAVVWDVDTGAQHVAFQAPVSVPGGLTAGIATGTSQTVSSQSSANTPSSNNTASNQAAAVRAKDKANRADKAGRGEKRKKRKLRDWKGIVSIAISPDGRYFGVAGKDGNVRLLDARFKERFRQKGHRGLPAAGIAFSPNGKRVISVGRDTGVNAWDNANGKKERTSFGHEHPIRTVAVSADGKFVASGGEETRVFLWDAATGKLAKILNGHADFVNCVAFSPDGQLLASGDAESRILLWDVATGKLVKTLLGHWDEVNAVAFSPDGRRLASGSVDSRVILWDVSSGVQVRSLNGHQGAVRTIAFSRDGLNLFSAGEDSRILGWNGETGQLLDQIGSLTGAANALVVTPDGMVVIGGDDNKVTEWDPKRHNKRQSATFVSEPQANNFDVSPFGRSVGASVAVSSEYPSAPERSTPAASSIWVGVVTSVLDWLIPAAQAAIPPAPGGPILVVTSPTSPFSGYYAEILRTEGLNEFAEKDVTDLTPALLALYDVVVLAPASLVSDQVTMLTDWVNAGGNLIAIKPDPQLAGLLGLSGPPSSTLSNGYLLVNTSTSAGNGIVNQTMQFHGTADRYALADASSIATLYSDAATSTSNPAVTLRGVGANGGQAAAFTYDLATSIVYTRQGNPAWQAQERDGYVPIRSDDKFYGDASFDSQADWIDFAKIAIPQADEQQRLLANLIVQMNLAKKPLPRFWYFPRGLKAVVIMTGDDHANNGTQGRFDQFNAASAPGCSVENWECVRGTSYIYPNTPLTDAQAAAYHAQGFEVGLHINTNCADFTPATLRTFYSQQLASFASAWPSVPAPITQRHHCIAWSDWATGAVVQLENGIRFDTTYYFWPPGWVQDRPGFFSGSGMPMRFANLDGTLIDVFHASSQMTDESGQTYPFTINTLLDRALGAEGYYGAFTINAHTDLATIPESDAVLNSAPPRGVPIVSSKQMLDWLDGRNSSSFGSLTWSGNMLGFTVAAGNGANGLQAMLPANAAEGVLVSLTRTPSGGSPVPVDFSVETIKGISYGMFTALAGAYVATYGTDQTAPTVTARLPAPGATGVSVSEPVTATFSEAIDASTLGSNFELRNGTNTVSAAVAYNGATRTATLTPSASLAAATVYTVTIKGGSNGVKDLAGNALDSDVTWTFTTGQPPCFAVSCTAWSASTVPGNPSVNDPGSVEVGVKFKSAVSGYITGIRFYQANLGTYRATLWTGAGQSVATADFTATTAGWQQANFAAPVAIAADTVYVASYFAQNGGYAADNSYFASQGVTNGPISLLQNGLSGGNGVYAYSSSSIFPSNTYAASNYWVDVAFTTSVPADATPPEITARSPAPDAIGVSTGAAVSVTFSEAMAPATINTSTIQLRTAGGALIPAAVTYTEATRIATLLPNDPLDNGVTLTATVKGGSAGVKDLAGNELAGDVNWSFTAAVQDVEPCSGATSSLWPTNPTPSLITDSDTASVELGVKFRPSVNGVICGIRFYKGPSNTGVHVGKLWGNTGVLLASAQFQNETASGWQQVHFASPVAVSANTVYVASYLAPVGRYSADSFYFGSIGVTSGPLYALTSAEAGGNGVYQYGAGGFPTDTYQASHYWVDVVFSTNTGPDTTPPTVSSTNPVTGATSVNPSGAVTATFSEAMDPGTFSTTTFELRGPSNSVVAGPVAYSAATNTATLTPTTALAENTTYTATILSGSSGVKDVAGNVLGTNYTWTFTTGVDPCSTGGNAIVCENGKAGNPSSEWDITGAGDASIQGFATNISVNRGDAVGFKIDTPSTNYRLDIYRMGYYAGSGARKIATVEPSATLPQNQPNCLSDAATGLVDCGNWAVSASWNVPTSATSGIYFAKAVREDGGSAGLASHIVFVVRDDDSNADLVFQTSDTTWQAYNTYGGNSLYTGSPAGRAYKVSYNRPFNTRAVDNGQDWVFNAEYPMVRWLEANGYNVSYITGVDADRYGNGVVSPTNPQGKNLLSGHKVFLSIGHDEYWSGQQRANVEAARDAGVNPVNLAFFSGNEVFWKTRWENSIDASGTAYRTMVCYKETHAGAKIDPTAAWTGTWRDPRFSPPADGGRPENALTGTIFTVNDGPGGTTSMTVPEADGKMRFWRNTSVASLAPGASATLPNGTLGYEWDEDLDNDFRPAGLVRLSTTVVPGVSYLQDYGSTYGSGTANHALTLYRSGSGALVFGAGTVQWTWGLDATHDRSGTPTDPRMQQATINLFADMGAQPGTLQSGLVSATASTDTEAPISTVVSPAAGSTVQPGASVAITGTAADTGGGAVGGVEVSVDGGATWHPAAGRGSWSYAWTVPTGTASPTVTIKTRAVDDSGNLEVAGPGVTVSLPVAPTSIAVTPANPSIAPGATQAFTATGTYAGGSTQNLTSQVAWASTNIAAATINSAGLATGVATGSTTISATLSGVSGSTTLSVATPVVVTTSSLAGGKIGIAYSATLTASGGTTPYTWSIPTGTLPVGLTLNTSTGAITGTPSASGTSNFSVQATDSAGRTASRTLSIAIASLNSIAVTPGNPTLQSGATQQFTATGTYSDGGTQTLTTSAVWVSSNTSAATITSGGLATAINGSATISATLNGVTGTTTLTVQSAPVATADRFLFRNGIPRTVDATGLLGTGVLANDTQAAGHSLSAIAVTNPLPSGVSLAGNGVVTINRTGATSFRYRASDGALLSLPTTGALVNLTVDTVPTAVAETCTYTKAADTVIGVACAKTGTRTFTMSLIANDSDANATTNVPTDGVGKTVTTAVISSTGTGVGVAANSACGQGAIVKSGRANIVNNCNGTITVTVAASAPVSTTSITFAYRALDDLGASSTARTDSVAVQ